VSPCAAGPPRSSRGSPDSSTLHRAGLGLHTGHGAAGSWSMLGMVEVVVCIADLAVVQCFDSVCASCYLSLVIHPWRDLSSSWALLARCMWGPAGCLASSVYDTPSHV
jgi:hypothetical protein